MSDDLSRKINRVFDRAETSDLDVHHLLIGQMQASAVRRSDRSAAAPSQLGHSEEFTPSEPLEDLLDMLLKEGRWAFLKDIATDWDVTCQKWINGCLLYEVHDQTLMPDEEFDGLSAVLLHHYVDLPEWFTARVDEGRLEAGTASGLTYTDVEHQWAHDWIADLNKPVEDVFEDLF